MTRARHFFKASLLAGALFIAPTVAASDIVVSSDWVRLGDVAAVSGPAAERAIAASPLPGQRLPLASEFIEAQASAAGFPVDLPDGGMIWVTRSAAASTPSVTPVRYSAPPPSRPTVFREEPGAGEVPVLNVDINRGDPITANMITYESIDSNRRIQGLIRSASLLEDTEATRTIRAGQPLSTRDIQAVSVISRGDQIQLIYENGPLRLIVSAKALSDAAAGDSVRVQNLQSNRSMDAVAWAPGEARVGSSIFSQEG